MFELPSLTVLARLAQRKPEHRMLLERALSGRLEHLAGIALELAVQIGDPIGGVLAVLIEREASSELVESILKRFDRSSYRDSTALLDVALASTRKALALRRELTPKSAEGVARLSNNIGFSLSRLGRQEEAREATQKAVTAFRSLYSTGPEGVCRLNLVVSLSNLGVVESNLGNYEGAMQATEEAVNISRGLAGESPGETEPVLAQSLINLGAIYFSSGLAEKALKETQEAVKILQRLAGEDPESFRANLARSLNNLGAILRSLDRFDEALEVTYRGLDLQRSLAARYPDVFLADLATSLLNLSGTLGEQMGRREEALTAIQEAVAIRRQIAARGPASTLLDFFDSLQILATSLLELGKQDWALQVYIESIDILQEAETHRPAETASRLRSLLERLTMALEDLDSISDPTIRIESLEHVVRSVTFFFRKQPLIFADPMNTALLTYLSTLLRAGKDPDRELLRSIIQVTEKEILEGSADLALRPRSGA